MFLWIDLMRDMVHFIYKKIFINIQVITSLLIKKDWTNISGFYI